VQTPIEDIKEFNGDDIIQNQLDITTQTENERYKALSQNYTNTGLI
jgi:hypothetical protein